MLAAQQIIGKTGASQRLWRRALDLPVETDHPPYDTLFVALAEREGTRLVTYDAKLLAAFPNVAVTPADFLSEP